MIKLGFLEINDVVAWAKNAANFNFPLLSAEQNFILMSLIDSFPTEYRALAKSFTDPSPIEEIQNDHKIRLGNRNSIPILETSSK